MTFKILLLPIPVFVPSYRGVLDDAVWHTGGRPWTRPDGQRVMLYYAYEHPWMMAGPEPVRNSPPFYQSLSQRQRQMFHSFVFECLG